MNNNLRTVHAQIQFINDVDMFTVKPYFDIIKDRITKIFGEDTTEEVESESEMACYKKRHDNYMIIIDNNVPCQTTFDIKVYNKDINKDIRNIIMLYDFLTESVKNITCTGLEVNFTWKLEQ